MMARVKYEIDKSCTIDMKYGNLSRPKTPPWLRKTVFGRHKSEFLIGGGIILSLLIVTGIVLASTLTKHGNVDVGPTKEEKIRKQDPNDDNSFSPSVECENFDEIVHRSTGPEIIRKNVFRKRFEAMIGNRERKETDKTIIEMKSFYEFCIDRESIKRYGLGSMKRVLNKMGGCAVDNFKSDNHTCYPRSFCLSPGVKNLREHFISAEVVPCPSTRKYCIELSLDLKMESQERCKEQMDSVCRSVGFFESVFCPDVPTDQTDCSYLSNSMKSYCEWLRMPTVMNIDNHSMTIDEHEKLYETDDARKLIRDTIPESIEITNQTFIYFQEAIIGSLQFSKDMLWRNRMEVVKWKYVNSFEFFLPQTLREKFAVNFKKLEPRDRRKGCANEILSAYPSSSLRMYKTEYYNFATQKNVERIFDDVKAGFRVQINWMDESTRDKLNAISLYTPEPKRDIFGSLAIDKTDPVQTVLNLKNLKLIRNFSYLNKHLNLEDEELFKLDKNEPFPQYMARSNQLYLPVETLHMYFEEGRPDYVNYVALGYTIARQIARGFHQQWFGENKEYSRRMDCFVKDRTKNQAKKEALNKIIADYMGLRAAYAAYDISIKRNGNPQSNHSTYNNHQMFWMTAGQLFSSQNTNELKLISYLDEFHRDFHCRIGSKMYPNQTCSMY